MKFLKLAALPLFLAVASRANAQIAVSANDNKVVLENGAVKVVPNPPPDTVSIIDLSSMPPKLVTEIQAPASVVGPPGSVAVAPDESYALVAAAMKIDPADPTKQAPDDKLSVIDLKSSPPKVVDTITVGKGAAGVSINRAGTLALVANRSEGTVSVLTISGGKVTEKEKIKLGEANSGPSQPVFTPDGTMALVTRDNDHKISVLSVQGDKVEYTKRDINAGLRP
jgi:DNA-binding beta-propeller fold protein YncE